jgi:hypothetical protein
MLSPLRGTPKKRRPRACASRLPLLMTKARKHALGAPGNYGRELIREVRHLPSWWRIFDRDTSNLVPSESHPMTCRLRRKADCRGRPIEPRRHRGHAEGGRQKDSDFLTGCSRKLTGSSAAEGWGSMLKRMEPLRIKMKLITVKKSALLYRFGQQGHFSPLSDVVPNFQPADNSRSARGSN